MKRFPGKVIRPGDRIHLLAPGMSQADIDAAVRLLTPRKRTSSVWLWAAACVASCLIGYVAGASLWLL